MPAFTDSDATQRVTVGDNRIPTEPQRYPTQHTAKTRQTQPRTSRGRNSGGINRKEKTIIIILLIIAAILLISIVAVASMFFNKPSDDGLIPNNVFAAGVNLGGMTEEEAKYALNEATKDTYTKLDMSVQVLDTTVTLPAVNTGAKLDVDAVVAAAMSSNKSSTISVLPYLNLDTAYIQSVVNDLGTKYSSTLTQGSITVEGTKPEDTQDSYDTSIAYQTLVIYVGTAEYVLSTDALYNQVLEAYDINLFQVVGQCSVVAPDPLNLENIFQSICYAPVDATLDTSTYEVTKEIYGYGFDLPKANELIAAAQYGDTITVPIHFIEPDITAEMLTSDLFRDVLAEFSTKNPVDDADWNVNLKLACAAINGQLIKSGDSFSFSQATGQPSIGKGYQKVEMFQGTEMTEVIGGGISQVATALYNCALLADLDILERHAHSYAPQYVEPGLDAMINWGYEDLIFSNTTNYPIRIEASVSGNTVTIRLIGTDDNDYYVKLETDVVKRDPTILKQTMLENNSAGYAEGDVLVEGIDGYDVIVYRNQYENQTNRLLNSNVQTYNRYEKRNEVVVAIQPLPEPTTPTEPSPDVSTPPTGDPQGTDPTGTTSSTEAGSNN